MALTLTLNAPSIRYGSVSGTTGVAPFVVQAHIRDSSVYAEDTDGGIETYPTHAVHFVWDFGDPTSVEKFVDPISNLLVLSNSDQTGTQACHIYRTPGTYVVTVTAYYFDKVTGTWAQTTAVSAAFTVSTELLISGWEVGYCNPDATSSLGTGSITEPFTTYAQIVDWLAQKNNRTLYLATGHTYTPLTNEVQLLTMTGTSVGGTFTLAYGSEVTGNIAYNATADTVLQALMSLTMFRAGDLNVTGSAGGPWTVTFKGRFGSQNIPLLTVNGAGLTGTTPVLTPTTSTAGGAAINQPVLTIAQTLGLRIHRYTPSGSYNASNPVLQLAASASGKAVISIQGNADSDAQNEKQRVFVVRAASGNFKLTWNGADSSNIAYNASAATVKTAITTGIAAITGADITVTGPNGGPWVLEFTGAYASMGVAQFTSSSVSLAGTTPDTFVETTQHGSAAHTFTSDVMIDKCDLDGNNSINSRGAEIVTAGTTKGYTRNTYLVDCRTKNTLKESVYVDPTLNNGGTQGPQGLGLIRNSFDASVGVGHTVAMACSAGSVVLGNSFRGGNGSAANDHHLYFAEITYSATPQLQLDHLIRWNGCAVQANTKKNFGLYIQGGFKRSFVSGNFFSGTRNGVYINRTTSTFAIPTDIILEGNAFGNLGLSTSSQARGVWLKIANNVSIRNSVFYENGYANGAADAEGADIFVENAGVVANLNDHPIRLEHNSHYRSYARCGSPLIDIDDDRLLHVYNNAYHYKGGVGDGTTPNRAIIRFTSASYCKPPRNERQQLSISGTPAGGTFRLQFTGTVAAPIAAQITANIAWNATAATVQTELEALAAIVPGDVVVTGSAGGPWVITFKGTYANTDMEAVGINNNSVTGTGSPTPSIAILVEGATGLNFFDGNRYYAPNLMYGGVVKPFVVNGSTHVEFNNTGTANDWANAGSGVAENVWDANGSYGDPSFRNPASGNFQFNATDPLVDMASDTPRGMRFDYTRGQRGDALPDVGAFEFTGGAGATDYRYQPSALSSLPAANGEDYRSGDIRYIEAAEPVRVTNDPETEVDNRPHKHLAQRDNILSERIDGLLADVNNTFCSDPQAGSSFTSPHHSMQSFIGVGHNPDGTIRLDALDLSSLPFLRIDGGNQMIAPLNVGDNRIINVATALGDTDGPPLGQVVQRAGDTIQGTITLNGGDSQVLDFAGHRGVNLGQGTSGGDLLRADQCIRKDIEDQKDAVLRFKTHGWSTGTYTGPSSAAVIFSGFGLNMGAVDDAQLANFDGHYIAGNTNPIDGTSGNIVYNMAYPTVGNDGANKRYVDDREEFLQDQIDDLVPKYFTLENTYPFTLPFTKTGLVNGKWLVIVQGIIVDGPFVTAQLTFSLTINGVVTKIVLGAAALNQLSATWSALVDVSGGSISITASGATQGSVYAQQMIGIRQGSL